MIAPIISWYLYWKFNSKNSLEYCWTPKNAWGGQKLQIYSNLPNLASYGTVLKRESPSVKILKNGIFG